VGSYDSGHHVCNIGTVPDNEVYDITITGGQNSGTESLVLHRTGAI
jgi:hypothetical protein